MKESVLSLEEKTTQP